MVTYKNNSLYTGISFGRNYIQLHSFYLANIFYRKINDWLSIYKILYSYRSCQLKTSEINESEPYSLVIVLALL